MARDSKNLYDWSLRGIRWGDVFKYQHWGGLLLFVPAIVIIGGCPLLSAV